jgi:hypothetical protein
MGYWGTLLAARTHGELPAPLRDRDTDVRDDPDARRGDGWQVVSVADNLIADGAVLTSLTVETGAPVLAAYIADSDYGWLTGVSPTREPWQAWLDAPTAFVFERDHHVMTGMSRADADRRAREMRDGFGLTPAAAARRAVGWAAEAGYRVPARPIRQILATRRPPGLAAWLRLPWRRYAFAEEMFFNLLDRLGPPRVTA